MPSLLRSSLYILFLSFLVVGFGCSRSGNHEKSLVTRTALASGAQLSLHSEQGLIRSGYNPVTLRMDGKPVSIDSMELFRDEDPEPAAWQALHEHGDYEMLLPRDGKWTIKGKATGGEPFELHFRAKKRVPDYIQTVTGPDSTTYLVAIVQPRVPKYGIERFETAVYRREEERYRPATGLQLKLRPWMHMQGENGHSSQYNEHPAPRKDLPGHYLGKIAFSMKGKWEVQLPMYTAAGTLIDTARFAVNVSEKNE